MRKKTIMKLCAPIVIAVAVFFGMVSVPVEQVSAGGPIGPTYMQEKKAKNSGTVCWVGDLRYSNKYSKSFKNAKKVIIYKKSEKSKKYKKVKTVKISKKYTDKKANGLIKYKYQPVYKNGKKGKKTKAFFTFGVKAMTKLNYKEVEKGTIVSFKVKNTSKKYKAYFSAKKSTTISYDAGEDYFDSKIYLTNKEGTKKYKKVVVGKKKTKMMYFMVADKKVASELKSKPSQINDVKVKVAKKAFSAYFSGEKGGQKMLCFTYR